MARAARAQHAALNANVFINCPFDDDYLPCFEAILFAITMSGYRVRCALEENDAGNIRFDKLKQLIRDSDHTIHDLSRVELNPQSLPRFNMPFELGLMMGARSYGPPAQRRKRACIMITNQHQLAAYLSDLAGNDPEHHNNSPERVVTIVRNFLNTDPDGQILPGPDIYARMLQMFKRDLPDLAQRARLVAPRDVHPRLAYRTHMYFLTEFCNGIKGLEGLF